MHRVPDTLKNSLHQWLAETAEKEHITAAQEGSADITSEQITQDSYYLLVKFEPSNDKKDEFEIHAWLTYEQDGKTMPVYGDAKEEVSLVEIPSILDELISQYEENAHAFTIKLFLPSLLLNCDTPSFDAVQPDIFQNMLSGGTSVALWPRQYCKHLDEEVIEQEYPSLLDGCHFSTLPKMVWERRKEAARDQTLLANHLTLFWDDPYRLP